MKRRALIVALVLAMVAIIAGGATLAYFTAEQKVENVFTIGGVAITLTEPTWESTGKAEAADLYPGEAVAKDPIVTCTSVNPCLVRVKVEWPKVGNMDVFSGFRTNYAMNVLGEGWVDGGDGYYYYTKPLQQNQATTALFDSVVANPALVNDATNTEYTITVTAYAVQAQGVFPSFSAVDDGIDPTTELPIVQAFFNKAFPTAAE